MRIDSHNHFWKYEPKTHAWIDESMKVIRRDFLPKDFKNVLQGNQIDGTIAVQAEQTEDDTYFLLRLADQFSFIKGVVGWVDLQAEDIADRLQTFSACDKLVGFRHMVQSETDPNFMLKEEFQRGLGLLKDFNFTYDILVYPNQLEMILKSIEQNPEQKFVINHLAKPNIKAGEFKEWAKMMKSIGSHKNVMCKLSGLVNEADWKHWSRPDFKTYLDLTLQVFGIDRVMFGSDWPVCLVAAQYDQVKGIISSYFESSPVADLDKVFGLNAMKFYEIDDR